MKTYLTLVYTHGRYENSVSFIRPRHLSTPTHRGAERMIARHLGLKPSDISVSRISEMVYAA